MNMKKLNAVMNLIRKFALFLFSFFLQSFTPNNAVKEIKQPNILLLLADDMGYGEVGVYGQKIIQTPILDDLANSGIRFTQFYSGNTVCSPSRASLLTGRHPGHVSIRGNAGYFGDGKWDRIPLKKDETTIAEMLKMAGYQNAFIGKWHVDAPNDLSTWAFARGFDHSIQVQWSSSFGGKKFDEEVHWINGMRDSVVYNPEQYDCIDAFRTNLAIDYLNHKDDSKPFFLFMSYRIPHGREQYIRDTKMYADKGWSENERIHAARITLLDREIGRLIQKLDDDDELSNTMVIFTSDNGPQHEGHDHEFFNSNGELRGYKRDLYEGGIRVPMIVYWKDKVKHGRVSDHVGAFWDFMPTFAELAGARTPETDGQSFFPEILGQTQKKHSHLYWEFQLDGTWNPLYDGGFRQAVRKGNWKAVRYALDTDTELYNLATDISETKNLAKDYPKIVTEMNLLFNDCHTENIYFPFGGVKKQMK
jgi:arylsulfatase A-like enzyme